MREEAGRRMRRFLTHCYFPLFFFCVSMYICAHVHCIDVQTWGHMCSWTERPEVDSRYLLYYHLLTYPQAGYLLLNPGLTHWLDSATSEHRDPPVSAPLALGLQKLRMWVLGFELGSSCLHGRYFKHCAISRLYFCIS